MNPDPRASRQHLRAFTLIELLVVISIIGILAAMLLPVGAAIKKGAIVRKAKTELQQMVTAIESYKAKYNFYPPDSPNSAGGRSVNQLYFELVGTSRQGTDYASLDGVTRIPSASVPMAFGAGVAGFVNCSKGGGDDVGSPAVNFLKNLKPGQYGLATIGGVPVRLLSCSALWTGSTPPVAGSPGLNPWRYVSTNPTNNPASFDLWVDVLIGGKTNRISNWSETPQIVSSP